MMDGTWEDETRTGKHNQHQQYLQAPSIYDPWCPLSSPDNKVCITTYTLLLNTMSAAPGPNGKRAFAEDMVLQFTSYSIYVMLN